MKRALEAELGRQRRQLNRSFADFAASAVLAEPCAKWQDAAVDYQLYSQALAHRFGAEEGALYSWGNGDFGQLGHGTEEGDKEISAPRRVAKPSLARALASGGMSNAVVTSEGVWTWGCSDQGALGREGDENFPALISLPLQSCIVVGVSLGDTHGACITLGGAVMIWGSYRDSDGKAWFPSEDGGKVGPGAIAASPKLLRLVDSAAQVCSGSNHTLVLRGDGSVWSWGLGEQGQLGRKVPPEIKTSDGDYIIEAARAHLTPAPVQGMDPVVRTIGAGAYHSMAVSANRCKVFACGLNQYRQVLDSETKLVTAMTHLPALDGLHVAQVEGGEHFSLARTVNGKVLSWGRSDQHQLGHADLDKAEAGGFLGTPRTIEGLADVADLACGTAHVLAVTKDGALYTWGFGESLQLGHGGKSAVGQDEAVPRKVAALGGKRVIRVSAGGQHSCALVEE